MGKGSSPRPFSVSQNEFADRYEAIFRKQKNVEQPVEDEVQSTVVQPDQTDDPKIQDDQ